MTSLLWLSTFCALFAAEPEPADGDDAMTPQRMVATVVEVGDNVQQEGNVVEFVFEGVPVLLVFDPHADRMRLVSPIAQVADLEEGVLVKAMQANFHSVLDARYAISNGIVWSVFIHPMSDLSDDLLRSAIRQVAVARVTFGKTYTSGEMVFGGGDPVEPGAEDPGQEPGGPGPFDGQPI
ncbi:MAG: type III secretion system chaperone [Planctomycetota bacterium]